MISLYERKTTQVTLVRKLSGYKSSHPLLEALTEYNRMVKANYLLNYIDDVSLRDYVQRALNRGEAYHQLRRAISSVNGDQFRGSSDEEIQLWNECARLMTNAIIHFNSAILSQLLTSFEYQQDEEKIQIVKQASPVAWYNINLKGTYNFQLSEKLPDLNELFGYSFAPRYNELNRGLFTRSGKVPPSGNVGGARDLDVFVPLRGKNPSTPWHSTTTNPFQSRVCPMRS